MTGGMAALLGADPTLRSPGAITRACLGELVQLCPVGGGMILLAQFLCSLRFRVSSLDLS